MSLSDYVEINRLLFRLRRIWNGAKTITPERLAESVAALYRYLTGKELPRE